ncbi:MAG TPA: hypothetical protein DHW76_03825, partial [Clostridiaceae bacterium]|nr:hypothetical protein [Clostridiaceae bacterium]HCL50117.1 hypothetical protein [Clostridiaceae bacterium]
MRLKQVFSIMVIFFMLFTLVPFKKHENTVFAQDVNKITNVSEIKPYDDVRGKDLSSLDLKDQSELLFTLDFDTYTKWPDKDKMPSNFNP